MKRFLGMMTVLAVTAALAQDTWTFEKPYVWSRDPQSITMAREGAVFVVRHTGGQDWSLAGFPRIPANPGDIFEMVCRVKAATPAEWANAETGVILRDPAGKELKWSYGAVRVDRAEVDVHRAPRRGERRASVDRTRLKFGLGGRFRGQADGHGQRPAWA